MVKATIMTSPGSASFPVKQISFSGHRHTYSPNCQGGVETHTNNFLRFKYN